MSHSIFFYIIVFALVAAIFQGAVFFKRCWGVPILEMPTECALMIYTSK